VQTYLEPSRKGSEPISCCSEPIRSSRKCSADRRVVVNGCLSTERLRTMADADAKYYAKLDRPTRRQACGELTRDVRMCGHRIDAAHLSA
jgi:hypothetical protein